ncbi:hypothetical protein [Streptomyces sp. NPDC057694]|uniref:hypothetical protein n=1 Tax=Streptomyces sp. NPDC057694 TaxID=3346216 RepID=UPI003681F91D
MPAAGPWVHLTRRKPLRSLEDTALGATSRNRTRDVLAAPDALGLAHHDVAVRTYHRQARTGGQLLFFPGRMSCSFLPTINRRCLPDSADFTDLSWYLHTLLPPLLTVGLQSYEACDLCY